MVFSYKFDAIQKVEIRRWKKERAKKNRSRKDAGVSWGISIRLQEIGVCQWKDVFDILGCYVVVER